MCHVPAVSIRETECEKAIGAQRQDLCRREVPPEARERTWVCGVACSDDGCYCVGLGLPPSVDPVAYVLDTHCRGRGMAFRLLHFSTAGPDWAAVYSNLTRTGGKVSSVRCRTLCESLYGSSIDATTTGKNWVDRGRGIVDLALSVVRRLQ